MITSFNRDVRRVPAPAVEGGGGGAAWPNEPVGNLTLQDETCSQEVPVGADVDFPPGWTSCQNPNTRLTRESDGAAPLSPPYVWQWKYVSGFGGGGSPASIFNGNYWTARKEVYIGLKFKYSNPWQSHSSGVNKMYFAGTNVSGGTAIDLQAFGDGSAGSNLQLDFVTQFLAGESTTRRGPNITTTYISRGDWHTAELYMKYSTDASTADGLVKVWLDGILQSDYSNVRNDGGTGWRNIGLDPNWGGAGDTKTADDYFTIDDVHVSYTP